MTLVPIGQGILASVVALIIVLGWLAIGSIVVRPNLPEDELLPVGAILTGSAVTSFCLALFTAAGFVRTGTAAVAAAGILLIIVRWRAVIAFVRAILSPYRRALDTIPVALSGIFLGLVLWLSAISPPRSADAMRYHLAHIRQIVSEGRWMSIADYHYALPFGWSLSYLPFELLGLPQGTQVLGLLVFVIFVSAIVRFMRRMELGHVVIIASSVLLLHPAVLRVFTEANADAYALLVILAIALVILRLPHVDARETAILGFASFVGLQSRYQLGAAAIASCIVFVWMIRRHPGRIAAVIAFGSGAIAALALASPFYIANAMNFGNPVWPLFIRPNAAGLTYVDQVAFLYSGSLTGQHRPGPFAAAIVTLFTTRFLFPLAIVIVGAIILATARRRSHKATLGWFGVVFLVEWAAMQPLLYPRFVLLMLPVATLCTALLLKSLLDRNTSLSSVVKYSALTVIVALVAFNAYVCRDSIQYALKGDARQFHRYTWFYDTYDWIGHHSPKDARFLVIVSSAHTYYLDRQYRRADPWVSGYVDWRQTTSGESLDSLLARGKFRYVIYESRDWSDFYGGSDMQLAMGDAYRKGLLKRVRTFDDTLFTSRFSRSYRTTRVHLLERTTTR